MSLLRIFFLWLRKRLFRSDKPPGAIKMNASGVTALELKERKEYVMVMETEQGVDVEAVKDKIREIRSKVDWASGNRIILVHDDGSEEIIKSCKGVSVKFCGKNSVVKIHEGIKLIKRVNLTLGEGAYVDLGKIEARGFNAGMRARNSTLIVGDNTSIRCTIHLNTDPNLYCFVGKNCIFATDIVIRTVDGHTILDRQNGAILNKSSRGVYIGDHVWLGQNCLVLKEASIPHDCIVAAGAIVGKKEFQPHSIIAGVPAKTVRTGITWNRKTVSKYEKTEKIGQRQLPLREENSMKPFVEFNDFPNIFGKEISPDQVAEARKELHSFPRDWMETACYHYTIDDFKLDPDRPLFSVDCNGVRYECLFLAKKSKKLFIHFSGGGRKNHSYPLFLRWKYGNRLGGNILCIEDPMQAACESTCVKWYYGTNDKSYLVEMLPLVKKAIADLGMSAEDVTFLGSSGGGYAALYMANLLDGSAAIALSPQTVLCHWGESTGAYFKKLGIDLHGEDKKFNRNRLVLTNPKSVFLMVVNAFSDHDYKKQFLPFCKKHGIAPKYGITAHNNIITWVHASEGISLHGCNLETEFRFMEFIISQFRNGHDINILGNPPALPGD